MGPKFDTWQLVVWNVLAGAVWLAAVADVALLMRRGEGNRRWQVVALAGMVFFSLNYRGAYVPIVPVGWLVGRVLSRNQAPAEPLAQPDEVP